MLPIVKVLVDETGETKAGKTFNAQWYPKVTLCVKRTGGSAHSVKLQGSMNNSDWVDIGSALTTDGILTNFDGTKEVWYPYYRPYITTNTGGTLNAWMGAGGT
jgi:hypothetical protein